MTLRAQNQRGGDFCVTFVFCIDYIEKNGQLMPQELFPLVFLAPRVLNFSIITFQKIYCFKYLIRHKKLPICTSVTLRVF